MSKADATDKKCAASAVKIANGAIAKMEENENNENENLIEEDAPEQADLEEGSYNFYSDSRVPLGVTSFADLAAHQEAEQQAYDLRVMVAQFGQMIQRIFDNPDVDDKVGAWQALSAEFFDLYQAELSEATDEHEINFTQESAAATDLSESTTGHIVKLLEDDLSTEENPRSPLKMHVRIIKPGWGNKEDNHYYPREMLKQYADKFVGNKMHVIGVGHKGPRTSETEVSVIESIDGFDPDGSPIARVAVFNPDFAEQVRNRRKIDHLDTLKCSIFAMGKSKKGKVGDRKGNIVTEITEGLFVDWVTAAGAGGQAISLLGESETEELGMEDHTEEVQEDEIVESEDVVLNEDSANSENPPEENEDVETEDAETQESDTEPGFLSPADITGIMESDGRLPVPARERLAEMQFKSVVSVKEAINAEMAYLESVTGSGQVFANDQETFSPPESDYVVDETNVAEADKVLAGWGFIDQKETE